MPTKSKVVGKIGVALPPTNPGVLDDAKAGKGYIGYYDGGAYGIPVGSKNKECALLWLQYFAQEKFQADWAVAGSRIILKSTYDEPKVQELDKITNGYFTMHEGPGLPVRRCAAVPVPRDDRPGCLAVHLEDPHGRYEA